MLGLTDIPILVVVPGFPNACRTYNTVPGCVALLPIPAAGKKAPPPLFTDASVVPLRFCHSCRLADCEAAPSTIRVLVVGASAISCSRAAAVVVPIPTLIPDWDNTELLRLALSV